MNQYVTTYRKDFFWPYVRTYPLRNGPTYATVSPPRTASNSDPCKCMGESGGGSLSASIMVAPEHADSYEWSRLGPMGPLLDPKLYPAKVGASPETPGMRINQPNTYLKKNSIQDAFPPYSDPRNTNRLSEDTNGQPTKRFGILLETQDYP